MRPPSSSRCADSSSRFGHLPKCALAAMRRGVACALALASCERWLAGQSKAEAVVRYREIAMRRLRCAGVALV